MFFNTKHKSPTKTYNLAGGEAFTETSSSNASSCSPARSRMSLTARPTRRGERVKQLVAEIPQVLLREGRRLCA